MEQEYDRFCLADPTFYDAMYSKDTAGESFSIATRPLPDGWTRGEQDDWFVVDSVTRDRLPSQGWKIHASTRLENAERVLDAVWEYCVARAVSFKFLRSSSALLARLSKYAPRGYSGKLVTIYPVDERECETILCELGEILDGEPGPYILSDLRWRSGPLYVRYGAFAQRYTVQENGRVVSAIADADGNLVPDRRGPVFQVPAWVALPEFLAPQLAARDAVTVADLPYTIERALHFSNGGGIYEAVDNRTGDRVVLKEGRPHAGLDARGDDAVRRIGREHEILRKLAGIPGIPRVHDLFWLGEHRFLVMEHVDGTVLGKAITRRYPLIDPSAKSTAFAGFTDWALDIHRQVEATMAAVHERGVVYGDLHLHNIIVRPDDTIALLDFEVAAPVDEGVRPGLGNAGFAAPRNVVGFGIDEYALACLRLSLFLPMTNLLGLHRLKARHYAEIIAEHFPVPPEFLAKAVVTIVPPDTPLVPSPRIEPDRDQWPALRRQLTTAIVASATPGREDRLFPGDIQQFSVGGLGLAYGAAGVLYALSVSGGGRYPQFEEWFVRRATNPVSGTRLGLYDGLSGVAFTLDHLGYRQEALDTLDVCFREKWASLGSDLAGGLPGFGLSLLHLADRTGESELREAAIRVADLVADRLGAQDGGALATESTMDTPLISGSGQPHAGLLHGCSGAALLLLRAYDETGDAGFLDRAAIALRRDLRRCLVRDNGVLEVNEGWRTMPYLDGGSVGIGLVLDEFLARRFDEQFAEAGRGVELAASSSMYILPGLFSGRAGILLYLAGRSSTPVIDPKVRRQVRGLAWHALPYGGGMAFPGTALRRLSMDLATGNAGILLALGAALHDQHVRLPLLGPVRELVPKTPAPTGVGR